jgi:HK97 family phage portal protein
MTQATVYACVRRRALDCARCTPRLYVQNADGGKTYVKDHPLIPLLKKPNEQQTWFEFAEMVNAQVLLRENGYAAIRRDKRTGTPIELIPINADAVMVLEASDGSVFYNVNRIGLWMIDKLRDFPTAIPSEDMLHIRGLTFNALVAASRIGLARDAIGLSMALEQQASRFVGNGARPAGVLETDKKLSDVVGKRLKESWGQFQSGVGNTGSTAVLEDGLKWKQLQLTGVDMEFIAQRNFSVLDICRFFGVPPHKVFLADKAASQNIPQQDQDYVNSVISGDVERWETRMEFTFDLGEDGVAVEFDVTRLLRADVMTRFNSYRLGILSGFLRPNEARRSENLEPDPAPRANELMVPSNTAALGSDATGTPPDAAGRPGGGNPAAPGVGTGGDQTSDTGDNADDAPTS